MGFGDLIHRKIQKQDIYIIRVEDNGFDSYEEYEVIPDTIGRCTGTLDCYLDDIYEGDIIEYDDGSDYFIGIIKFESGSFGIFCNKTIPFESSTCKNFISLRDLYWSHRNILDYLVVVDLKIIGNIYDTKQEAKI